MLRSARLLPLLATVALGLGVLGTTSGAPATGVEPETRSVAAAVSPTVQVARSLAFTVTGSVHQVDVVGAPAGASAALERSGRTIASKKADSLGGIVFYHVPTGTGYRVKLTSGQTSRAVTVHSARSKPWNPGVYDQTIADQGYQYITMRDGTKLALTVHPPTQPAGLGTPPVTLPAGPDYAPPYPTLIEYSGYGYARPSSPENGIAVIANLMGFAVVDVNMRGTGCSGGAYNFFETLQDLDGYDIVQTIARQPWVKDHKVGMMGISYGAISQLFTAQTRPPALEAISPLSTIDATASTLYPGGLLNTGFAVAWAAERQQNAEPATGPDKGQSWAYDQIKSGDQQCAANQVLHGEAGSLPAKIAANSHYRPHVADQLDPITFVHKIDVPVFMACQFEDEQTGGHCPDLAEHFTGTRHKWFTFTNGAHIDSLDPATLNRWYDFLSLYVAHQPPALNSAVIQAAAPIVYQQAMGLPSSDSVTLPADPIQQQPTYAGALAAFQALPQVRVLFDNGAGASPTGQQTPGNPYPGFERSYARFPVPGTTARTWYLGAGGKLTSHRAGATHIDSYRSNAHAVPLTDFGSSTGGGGLWGVASQWDYHWRQHPRGTSLSYVSAPLSRDTAVVGAGSLQVWVRSSTPDVDLQASISEISPAGNETFVQNGYLRASERKLDHSKNSIFRAPSTRLEAVPSLRAGDAAPMPRGKFVRVTIPMYYEGHMYRKGTRIRIVVSAPNGLQPVWSFSRTAPRHVSHVSLAMSRSMPSDLVLPVVPGGAAPTAQPACPSLRNEPCRPYVARD